MLTNQDLHEEITKEFTLYKRNKTSDAHRLQFASDITERYFAEHGEFPSHSVLERLGTLLMYDVSTNSKSNKTRTEEYPVLSENQYRRRVEGRHKRRIGNDGNLQPLEREVPFSLATTVAIDGRNYAYPTRRKIDVLEQLDIEYYGKGSGTHVD